MCRKARLILSLDSTFIKFFPASYKAFKLCLTMSLDMKDSKAGAKSVVTDGKIALVPKITQPAFTYSKLTIEALE